MRPLLTAVSLVPLLPLPWGMVDRAARVIIPATDAHKERVHLPTSSAQLVRARGVPPADGTRRVVLYIHGGAFLTCGANSHGRLVEALSKFADSPVLVVNYRLVPKHTVEMAVDDCHDAYWWLRMQGYDQEQIVLAGDSAGGYLALALAQQLQRRGEEPAALVAMSPFLQMATKPRRSHPNCGTDAMFPARAFEALTTLVATAAERAGDDEPRELYEPLDHIEPGLPRTLIHVSGSEALLHDARLAAAKLAAAGVPTEVRVWPGQLHDFQLATPLVPEATRSLRHIGNYIREVTE